MPRHTHTPDCGCGDEHEYVVRVTTSQEGARVRTDLGRAPVAVRSRVLAALAVHLDVPRALEPLAKGEELPASKANVDARYPALETLIQRARRDWASFGEQLIEKVVETLRGHSELTAELRAELQELFRAHEAAVLMRFAGVGDKAARQRAVDAGFIKPGTTVWSNVDVAYRAGVGMPLLMQAVQDADPEVARAQAADVVEAFAKQPMTATETVALDFARKRAARLMRRPIQDIHDAFLGILEPIGAPVAHEGTGGEAKPRPPGEGGAEPGAGEGGGAVASDSGRPASRVLTADEYAKIRPVIERAILERRSAAQLARDLREAVAGTQLTNDMERVARTELRAAHAEGAYQKLKTQTAAVGIADPLVYKMTSPTGCKQCIRIWGRGGSTRYRLSQVEAWEEQGGNYGRPAASWGPTIGPVHPNCFPAGTLITVQGCAAGKPIEDVQVGDVVLTHRGRWRAVTATMDRIESGSLHHLRVFSGPTLISTGEHPISTPGGWVEMQRIQSNDRVQLAGSNAIGERPKFGGVRDRYVVTLTQPVRVFNFSVHEDESYVANGVVVHNCTCGPLLLYVGERQHAAVLNAVEQVMSQINADRATGA